MLENFKEKESCVFRLCVLNQDSEYFFEKIMNSSFIKFECEVLLVGIIFIFFYVYLFGVSIEYICFYLYCFDNKICISDVECFMGRFQYIFKQEMIGVGVSLEKRWKFCGFEGLKLI